MLTCAYLLCRDGDGILVRVCIRVANGIAAAICGLRALRRAALTARAHVGVGVGVGVTVSVYFAAFTAIAFLIFVVVVFAVLIGVAVVVVCAFILDTAFFALGVASIE